jgi:hypothetical protein
MYQLRIRFASRDALVLVHSIPSQTSLRDRTWRALGKMSVRPRAENLILPRERIGAVDLARFGPMKIQSPRRQASQVTDGFAPN